MSEALADFALELVDRGDLRHDAVGGQVLHLLREAGSELGEGPRSDPHVTHPDVVGHSDDRYGNHVRDSTNPAQVTARGVTVLYA